MTLAMTPHGPARANPARRRDANGEPRYDGNSRHDGDALLRCDADRAGIPSARAPCLAPGYTLAELLVAVAICGILAALAYPGFQDHMVRTRRTEAQAALQRLMQQQERYFTLHNRYVAFAPDVGADREPVFRWWSGTSPARSAYEIAALACDDQPIEQCVQLVATPGTERVDATFRDALCERLILTSTGERRATGRGERCWR